ncbi:hypothetical protein PQI07_25830 [Methylobacterium sp. 092160098-2]|uniref:hypothetical protein n=1 Tax=Methylobacterium sp. 092160098-2 TaxID=3025129 RepID=UPI002381B686|nr:hypothetical protein [Methylobacterium sp. 092160098-2]MDE4914094.1 hypothetical protein [Methylobacterium sp. 092160098-2]
MDDVLNFQNALESACSAAKSEGLFYDKEVQAFVRGQCDAQDPVCDNHLGIREIPYGLPQERLAREAVEAEVKAAPRGTWATLRRSYERDGREHVFYNVAFSDGLGEIAVGSKHDNLSEPPTFEAVYDRVLGYEIYLARQRVDAADRLRSNREAIESGRVHVGAVFKEVKVNSIAFSKAEVVSVDPDKGEARVRLTKRGSRKRLEANVPAAGLSPAPKAAPEEPAPGGAPSA